MVIRHPSLRALPQVPACLPYVSNYFGYLRRTFEKALIQPSTAYATQWSTEEAVLGSNAEEYDSLVASFSTGSFRFQEQCNTESSSSLTYGDVNNLIAGNYGSSSDLIREGAPLLTSQDNRGVGRIGPYNLENSIGHVFDPALGYVSSNASQNNSSSFDGSHFAFESTQGGGESMDYGFNLSGGSNLGQHPQQQFLSELPELTDVSFPILNSLSNYQFASQPSGPSSTHTGLAVPSAIDPWERLQPTYPNGMATEVQHSDEPAIKPKRCQADPKPRQVRGTTYLASSRVVPTSSQVDGDIAMRLSALDLNPTGAIVYNTQWWGGAPVSPSYQRASNNAIDFPHQAAVTYYACEPIKSTVETNLVNAPLQSPPRTLLATSKHPSTSSVDSFDRFPLFYGPLNPQISPKWTVDQSGNVLSLSTKGSGDYRNDSNLEPSLYVDQDVTGRLFSGIQSSSAFIGPGRCEDAGDFSQTRGKIFTPLIDANLVEGHGLYKHGSNMGDQALASIAPVPIQETFGFGDLEFPLQQNALKFATGFATTAFDDDVLGQQQAQYLNNSLTPQAVQAWPDQMPLSTSNIFKGFHSTPQTFQSNDTTIDWVTTAPLGLKVQFQPTYFGETITQNPVCDIPFPMPKKRKSSSSRHLSNAGVHQCPICPRFSGEIRSLRSVITAGS
ncbi:hypothetical protein CcaCcLH18_00777 [Colletotrichum camelliae]|nr:hypothetical protein CcaCcLH18_00777 [Colletotrichum camelliae]